MPPPKRRLEVSPKSAPSRRNGPSVAPASTRLERKPKSLAPTARPVRVQFEVIAWLTIAAVAFGLRLINLDGNPLQPAESVLAMDSWRILQRDSINVGPSPLLIYLNTLLFLTLGATDAVARAAPAVVGWLVAMCPILLRHRLGRLGALLAAAILATSPTLVLASRSVDPTMLSLGAGLGLILLIERCARRRVPACLYAAGVMAALLLTSGPLAFDIVVILIGFAVIYGTELLPGRAARSFDTPEWDGRRDGARRAVGMAATDGGQEPLGLPGVDGPFRLLSGANEVSIPIARGLIVSLGLTGVLLGTGLATNLQGLGDAVALPLTIWAGSFSGFGAHPAWLYPALMLAYEPVSVVFGITGAFLAFREGRTFRVFLSWWTCVGFLLLVLSNGADPLWNGFIVVPLGMLAGQSIGVLTTTFADREQLRRLGVFAVVVGPLIATLLIAFGHVTLPDPVIPREVALAPPLALTAFVAAYALAYDWRNALNVSAGVVAICLLAFNVHAATLLNPGGALNPAELFLGMATSRDVRRMATDVAMVTDELQIARQIEGLNVSSDVEVAAPYADPLAWYLRGEQDIRVVPRVDDSPAVAIVGSNDKAPRGAYAGELFQVWTSAPRPKLSFDGLWRWWMYREAAGGTGTYVKVFVKTQLAR